MDLLESFETQDFDASYGDKNFDLKFLVLGPIEGGMPWNRRYSFRISETFFNKNVRAEHK